MHSYRVAGYAKLAKYWERDREKAMTFHRDYFERKYAGNRSFFLTGVYIDITGQKEIRKRPEMLCLLRECMKGTIDVIDMSTKGFLAANTRDFCYMIRYLFDLEHRIDIVTEDIGYNINTLDNDDGQREALDLMTGKYCSLERADYCNWKKMIMDTIKQMEAGRDHVG